MFKNHAKKVAIAITGIALALSMSVGVTSAYAATETIGGYLNTSGALVQYATYRTKQGTGSIDLNVYNMPSGSLRLGLINTSGVQFSGSIQWDRPGWDSWLGVYNGTRFAFQGRMQSSFPLDNYWEGTLNY